MVSGSSGCTRSVLIEGGYVFKAVHRLKDANQNRAEWDFYTMTTDEIRAKLAKPLYISRNGNIIVMEVLTPWYSRKDPKGDVYGGLTQFEESLLNLTNSVHGLHIGDLHGGNWGIRADGTVLLLDYGSMEWHATHFERCKLPTEKRYVVPDPIYVRDFMVEMLLTKANN
jgi:hypothetical protein